MISWKATAIGIGSAMPIVRGEGPLEPIPRPTLLDSKLPMLSVRDIAGDEELVAFLCNKVC